jgi:hypothetical protein
MYALELYLHSSMPEKRQSNLDDANMTARDKRQAAKDPYDVAVPKNFQHRSSSAKFSEVTAASRAKQSAATDDSSKYS